MMTPTHEFKKKRKAEYLKKRRENWGHVKLKPTDAKMKRRPKKLRPLVQDDVYFGTSPTSPIPDLQKKKGVRDQEGVHITAE